VSKGQNLLNNPESIVFDQVRNCYLVSNWAENSGEIVRIDSAGNQSYFSTALQNQFQVAGLYIYGDTLLAAAGVGSGAGVAGFNLETAELEFFVEIPGIGLPNDITSDTSGIIYVTDYWGDRLYKIINHTPYLFISQNLNYPNGIYYDELYNRLLIVSVGGPGVPILQVTLEDSTLSTLAVTGLAGGDGIIMDADRNLYLSEWTNDFIYKYDSPFTGSPEIFSTGHNDPADIYFYSVNSLLCVPNFSSNTIDFVPVIPQEVRRKTTGFNPEGYELYPAYPNPFNPFTVISFNIPDSCPVCLKVYGIDGCEVANLISENLPAGFHEIVFNAKNLTSGVYFVRLEAGEFNVVQKTVLIK